MSKIRVLLVDDEEDYVKAMAERMDMRDLQSQVALSGEEALRVLEDDPPNVIVLDLRMPGMQGMEVLEKVRACAIEQCFEPRAILFAVALAGRETPVSRGGA